MPELRIPGIAILLAGLMPVAGAVDISDDPACTSLKQIAIPAADQPDAAARARLSGCSSESAYYADDGKPDYVQARLCAYLEREQGDELVFGGSGVLLMIYANGDGVARNLPLAKRFACEVDGAPAEREGRLQHLDAMAAAGAAAERFDLCDDITSGYMMGFCASREAEAAKAARDRRTSQLTASWNAAERAAFATLRSVAETYFDAVVDGEVDMGGTARGAMAVGAREELEQAFAQHLAEFEQGRLPAADEAALAAADKSLNASYAAAMKAAKPEAEGDTFSSLGTVRPEGIRTAERAWIKYRDAWVTFGAQKYPSVTPVAWRTHFTRERDAALRTLAGE